MDCFKKIVSALFVLVALFAGDALAQCGGKVVYIQLPEGWLNAPVVNFLWEGGWRAVTGTVIGKWTVITIPTGLANDGNIKNEIIFADQQTYNNQTTNINTITKAVYTSGKDLVTTDKFYCSDFAESGTWIMENPNNPGKTSVKNQAPDAYYFFFLPPKGDEWTLGTPSLVSNGGNQKVKFGIDADHCGWYKITWFNEPVPEGSAWIWLNASKNPPDDKVGLKGVAEDPSEWPDGPEGNPTPFDLVDQFKSKVGEPGELYYDANGEGNWQSTWPGTSGSCTYKVAAIIYDTDSDVNPAFVDNGGSGSGTGVAKNIVGSTLVNGKMTFNQAKDNWTAERFKWAFEPTPGKNVVRCYDMPFQRNKATGLWEFNSNKLCNDNFMDLDGTCSSHGGYMGGYFPPDLQNRTDADYSQCNGCDKARKAEPWVPLDKTKQSQFCYDRARTGTGNGPSISTCGTAELGAEGHFRTGDDPPLTQFWLWGERATFTGGAKESTKNELFCFESAPATFVYEKGQEFFFSGDDDIWVFINDRLAIDLGGTHLAAPGYVNLDNSASALGLVEGGTYNMNIFFCDRRTTMSNVRIATNMYFSQNTGLYVDAGRGSENDPAYLCVETGGGGSCSDLASGGGGGKKKLCGNDIRDLVEYYIVNRKGDETILFTPTPSPGTLNSNCRRDRDKLTCYGGVVIDLSKGTASVNKDKIVDWAGTGSLWARLVNAPDNKSKIGSIPPGEVKIRMVWGKLEDDSSSPIANVSNLCSREGSAVTGERFPVCFANVISEGPDWFEIDTEGGPGSTFSLSTSGFYNEFGNFNGGTSPAGLRVFTSETGSTEIPFDEISRPFTIPDNGVLVLWVTGGYEQKSESWDYTVNVSGKSTEGATLHSLLPRFEWTKGPGSTEKACNGVYFGSSLDANKCTTRGNNQGAGVLDYIWVGEGIDLSLRVFNGISGKTCKTCDFGGKSLNWSAQGITAPSSPTSDAATALIGVPPGGITVSEGEANFTIVGRKEALLVGSSTPINWTTFTVWGPVSDYYTAKWDSLQFKKPPVPLPEDTYIYDDDGDGVGDRIKITYSRGFRRDSLPNMLEVKWDKDTTVLFGLATLSNGQYSKDGIGTQNNIDFWSHPEHYIKLGAGTSATTINDRGSNIDNEALELRTKDTIILFGKFSKKVLTQGNGNVVNWATFQIGNNAPQTTPLTGSINEKIPAIIVNARYAAGGDCANTVASPCLDNVVLTFSEPVKSHPNAPADNDAEALRNPFAYKLIDKDGSSAPWDILRAADIPSANLITFGNRRAVRPLDTGDSTVTIRFNRYREGDNKSGTPMPGDSVKFAFVGKPSGFAQDIFIDLNGNGSNPNEIGRKIEGRKPFQKDKLSIGEIDPNYPDEYIDKIKEALRENGSDENSLNDLFSKGRPVELLPVPDGWNIDRVREEFPGTIGILISPDISNSVAELEAKYGLNPGDIKDGDIHIYPRVFYHTNLGSFVAESGSRDVRCDDPIFPISPSSGAPSCKDSKSKFYIAWDMKDMKGRFVGAGAYVGLYDFRWEVNIPGKGVVEKMDSESFERKVEMHGVKRVKKK